VNALENWFCSTSLWQGITERRVLPWILSGCDVGDHVLELGSGPGATTRELRRRAPRVTSLEYSHHFAADLAARQPDTRSAVLQGDAAILPFADGTFSLVTAMLVLHHLRSSELQKRAFTEIRRVLRPGGTLVAFEIPNSWLNRAFHIASTFVPVDPMTVPALLAAAGFAKVNVNVHFGGFRLQARRGA
jgi:ubiquinone/menaquinone biosynthesis C-methylase UbiE